MWKLAKFFVYLVHLTMIAIISLICILGADDDSANAETIQDLICHHVCPSLDRGLTRVEKFVQFEWSRWKERTMTMSPRPLEGRSASCGRLPDSASTARCCADDNARLMVEYVGEDPYLYPEIPWRVICKSG